MGASCYFRGFMIVPGSRGQSPPRVRVAMAMRTSGLL
jgi:hypothetical protein